MPHQVRRSRSTAPDPAVPARTAGSPAGEPAGDPILSGRTRPRDARGALLPGYRRTGTGAAEYQLFFCQNVQALHGLP